jgi:aryl-alcohol dehydrogenase-like predicted oxidoreductase
MKKEEMRTRPLGSSGIQASVVGLGTFAIGGWFYGGTDEKDSIEAIQASIENGISLVDTAPIYGYGVSETIVGKAIKGRRDKVVLATKAGLVWDRTDGEFFINSDDASPTEGPSKYAVYKNLRPESIIREVELSLKRLDTDYIDLYQTHWQDGTTPIEVTMEALLKLKEQGKIRAIGVSNINVAQLKEYGDISSAQEKFSMIDRGNETNGIVDYCFDNHIAILSYFTLEQGLLTGAMSPERVFPDGDTRKGDPKFSSVARNKIQELFVKFSSIADKYGVSLAQLIIALTASQRGITHVLIGARNRRQAEENAGGGRIILENDDIAYMNSLFADFLQ